MIRSMIAALVFFTATTALATPKVGDFASFNVAYEQNGQKGDLTLSREIKQYNAANDSFLVHQIMTFAGTEPSHSEEWQTSDNFLSDDVIDSVLGNCAGSGGTPQSITVPAGTFNTCALSIDSDDTLGMIWIAKVPFGVARIDQTNKQDGTKSSAGLASYR